MDDHKSAYAYHLRLVAHHDSIRTTDEKKQLDELMLKYETAQRESEIEMLQKDRSLQTLELARRDEMLRRHDVERIQRMQEIELLGRTAEIRQLEMDMTAANLRSTEAEAARKQQKIALLEKDRELKIASLGRETMLRNGAIAGALLVLLLSMLLYRHLRQRRQVSELRAEVAESNLRTAEVETLRVQAEAERKEKDIQRQFSHRLLDSQEQERKRIAAELHDELSQDLIILKNRILLLEDEERSIEDRLREVSGINTAVSSALEDVRRISRNLRPMQLDRLGLTSSIRSMLRAVRESSDTAFEWTLEKIDGLFPRDREINVYRILQEGVNNILKHAEAQKARITVTRQNGGVQLTISDDGRGFDTRILYDMTEEAVGFGLQGMRERVELLGGNMNITSEPGEGTEIAIYLPVPGQEGLDAAEQTQEAQHARHND
jgi:signal transduction histidine kinase